VLGQDGLGLLPAGVFSDLDPTHDLERLLGGLTEEDVGQVGGFSDLLQDSEERGALDVESIFFHGKHGGLRYRKEIKKGNKLT
jgi:hypothetical protein